MRVIVAVAVAVEASVGVTDGVGNSVATATSSGVTTVVVATGIGDSASIGSTTAGGVMHPAKTNINNNEAVDDLDPEISRIIREIQSTYTPNHPKTNRPTCVARA